MRVAIVGCGPAGFYAAAQLLGTPDLSAQVDMFDRLATPWGLVRAGVAPDHPKIKSVTRVYEKIAALPGYRFHGNVDVGSDVMHEELAASYNAVIYAVGAATDRPLGIPAEGLPGSHAATAFVGWYNGHPDYTDEEFNLSATRAVVIGNGNVALDVARMLAVPAAVLATTDIADHALAAFATSAIREVVVLGRRGAAQAAFTAPELRELGELDDVDIVVDPAEVGLDLKGEAASERRAEPSVDGNVALLQQYARLRPAGRSRRIVLRFCVSPVEICGGDKVEGVRVVRNELRADARGCVVAEPTNEHELIEAGLVLRSIGYRGTPPPGLPGDETAGTLLNRDGRVVDPATGAQIPGVYAAGWIKRGPSGVIGTNKKCANETVASLIADWRADSLPEPSNEPDDLIESLRLRGTDPIDYEGWTRIDEYERGQGAPRGRPRVKLVRHEDLLRRGAASLVPRSEGRALRMPGLWICESCGYIYDPANGDIDGGIPPGTPFDDIPDTWFCPVCGARKAEFEPYEG